MTKEELLLELKDVYLQLRPSSVHGIGVFAIRDIPKGCRDMFSKDQGEWLKIPLTEVEIMPDYLKKLIENYFLFDDQYYYVEKSGFKKPDLSFFLNHSDHPNIISIKEGECFETITNIKAGEELFINYGEIV
ncbi:MAG: SET domain-containing protein-lysine N-methyltransferase [Flavisolibacter sp.]